MELGGAGKNHMESQGGARRSGCEARRGGAKRGGAREGGARRGGARRRQDGARNAVSHRFPNGN